jgi:hypothetical protein
MMMDSIKELIKSKIGVLGSGLLGVVSSYFLMAHTILPDWDASEQETKYLLSFIFGSFAGIIHLLLLFSKLRKQADRYRENELLLEGRRLSIGVCRKISELLCAADNGTKGIGHYIESRSDPTPLSSAYAIRAILASPGMTSAPLTGVLQYIYSCQKDNGWHAASQGKPRPEVTADIAGVIRSIEGRSKIYTDSISSLSEQIKLNISEANITYVAATVLACLPEDLLDLKSDIAKKIIGGFVNNGNETGYWCEYLSGDSLSENANQEPSPAFTARCLIALSIHNDIISEQSVRKVCSSALRWLSSLDEFRNEQSHIVRKMPPAPDEILVPRHFTAALVVIAAARCFYLDGAEKLADRAMKKVIACNREGLWRWNDGKSPVWMNSFGVEAVTRYAEAKISWGNNGRS